MFKSKCVCTVLCLQGKLMDLFTRKKKKKLIFDFQLWGRIVYSELLWLMEENSENFTPQTVMKVLSWCVCGSVLVLLRSYNNHSAAWQRISSGNKMKFYTFSQFCFQHLWKYVEKQTWFIRVFLVCPIVRTHDIWHMVNLCSISLNVS